MVFIFREENDRGIREVFTFVRGREGRREVSVAGWREGRRAGGRKVRMEG